MSDNNDDAQVSSPESLECVPRVIWPACLASEEEDYATATSGSEGIITGDQSGAGPIRDQGLLITGWGKMGQWDTWSRMLRMASVPIASTRECETNVNVEVKIFEILFIHHFSSSSIPE